MNIETIFLITLAAAIIYFVVWKTTIRTRWTKQAIVLRITICIILLLSCYFHVGLANETSYHSAQFDGSGFINVNGKRIIIPKKLPFYEGIKEPIYSTISNDKQHHTKNVHIEFGLTKGCFGQNVCDFATYTVEEISPQLSSNLMQSFEATATKIVLHGNKEGYYLPSICYAYCNEAKLFWFNGNRIYMIGTKFGADNTDTIQQLKDSANSLTKEVFKTEAFLEQDNYINDQRKVVIPVRLERTTL